MKVWEVYEFNMPDCETIGLVNEDDLECGLIRMFQHHYGYKIDDVNVTLEFYEKDTNILDTETYQFYVDERNNLMNEKDKIPEIIKALLSDEKNYVFEPKWRNIGMRLVEVF